MPGGEEQAGPPIIGSLKQFLEGESLTLDSKVRSQLRSNKYWPTAPHLVGMALLRYDFLLREKGMGMPQEQIDLREDRLIEIMRMWTEGSGPDAEKLLTKQILRELEKSKQKGPAQEALLQRARILFEAEKK